jgi:hypothetical protein
MFRTEANRINFFGGSGEDFLPVIATLHNLINKQGYQDIYLDFSGLIAMSSNFIIPIVCAATYYRNQKIDFEVTLPSDEKCANLIVNTNWAHLFAPLDYASMEDKNIAHLSAIRYRDGDEHYEAVDRCVDVILRNIRGLDRGRIKALEWSLNEITDNVLNHANSPIGGIVQVMTNTKIGRVDFFVCDAGVSIPRTLRQGRPDFDNDAIALRRAIDEGVTKNTKTNQGNGLYGAFNCCKISGGTFDITSGNVSLQYRSGGRRSDFINVKTNQIPFSGTFIHASINYRYEDLLEHALVFKGKRHDPGYDYVERKYSHNGDIILFEMQKEFSSFGTRAAGRSARNKIENLMDNKKNTVEFDFFGIKLISSSFADEVFGFLCVDMGLAKYNALCKFKNIDQIVRGLIDRAIMQRIELSHRLDVDPVS